MAAHVKPRAAAWQTSTAVDERVPGPTQADAAVGRQQASPGAQSLVVPLLALVARTLSVCLAGIMLTLCVWASAFAAAVGTRALRQRAGAAGRSAIRGCLKALHWRVCRGVPAVSVPRPRKGSAAESLSLPRVPTITGHSRKDCPAKSLRQRSHGHCAAGAKALQRQGSHTMPGHNSFPTDKCSQHCLLCCHLGKCYCSFREPISSPLLSHCAVALQLLI